MEKVVIEQEKKKLDINMRHMQNGVKFVDINTAYIDEEVKIGKGTEVGPCVTLQGSTEIGEDCIIMQNTRIKNSTIGSKVEIESSVVVESVVGDETTIGPFAYLRPKSNIGKKCKVGDFVEVKNANMGDGSKASHLTYIGDGDIGKNVNLGCGVVFVNYDGSNKARCVVEDGAFIGCNSNLVAPVTVEEGAYIAAGSTITTTVPKDALAIARAHQRNIEQWASKKGLYKKNK